MQRRVCRPFDHLNLCSSLPKFHSMHGGATWLSVKNSHLPVTLLSWVQNDSLSESPKR